MPTNATAVSGIRVLVIDDGRLSRECLAAKLESNGVVTDSAWNLSSLFAAVDAATPDVILLNITTTDSTTLLQISLDIDPNAMVVVYGLCTDRESEIVTCAEAGVAGLHLRSESFDHLLTLIANARAGRAQCSAEVSTILLKRVYSLAEKPNMDTKADLLTAREIEILDLIDQGLTNQQIASRLSVALHTVKNHVHNMLTKLGVATRAEAVSVLRAARFTNPAAGQQDSAAVSRTARSPESTGSSNRVAGRRIP